MQFFQNVAQMDFYRIFSNVQGIGNFFVRRAGNNLFQNLNFSGSQLIHGSCFSGLVMLRLSKFAQNLGRHRTRNGRFALAQPVEHGIQLLRL